MKYADVGLKCIEGISVDWGGGNSICYNLLQDLPIPSEHDSPLITYLLCIYCCLCLEFPLPPSVIFLDPIANLKASDRVGDDPFLLPQNSVYAYSHYHYAL